MTEIKKMKRELEDKLKSLNEQLDELNKEDPTYPNATTHHYGASHHTKKADHKKIIKIAYEDQAEKQKKAMEFVHKMQREKHEREKRELERRLNLEKNIKHEIEHTYKKRIESEEKLKAERRDKILNKLNHRPRDIEPKEGDEPLYKRMEKKYKEEILLPEIERREKELQNRKKKYKPFGDNELDQYAHKQEIDSKKQFLLKQANRYENQEGVQHRNKKYYRSPIWKKVKEVDEEFKAHDHKASLERKMLRDKQRQYGKLVKEMYYPKVDDEKRSLSRKNLQEVLAKSEKSQAYAHYAHKYPSEKYVKQMRGKYQTIPHHSKKSSLENSPNDPRYDQGDIRKDGYEDHHAGEGGERHPTDHDDPHLGDVDDHHSPAGSQHKSPGHRYKSGVYRVPGPRKEKPKRSPSELEREEL
eukprot:CAMPEP_0114580426 /NCGR_PEP_ID=MMETSP0125-20121206/4717_1 /TAXON_ID=485358 ORGANISM="Aristerostoma sp., Strain ATCC 50986" /NCGR_SAMPLE_ID=MMETSP0125 /ASSEMBLY_ACC=CAM_ASM_000245 /LENGTH=413 /DNA_ID=CAMNT_0001771987 /DNA_START=961 /DNA_END=2202 /DNA_ORIENTATION=-